MYICFFKRSIICLSLFPAEFPSCSLKVLMSIELLQNPLNVSINY